MDMKNNENPQGGTYASVLPAIFKYSIVGMTDDMTTDMVNRLREAKTSFALTQDKENHLWLSEASEQVLIEQKVIPSPPKFGGE